MPASSCSCASGEPILPVNKQEQLDQLYNVMEDEDNSDTSSTGTIKEEGSDARSNTPVQASYLPDCQELLGNKDHSESCAKEQPQCILVIPGHKLTKASTICLRKGNTRPSNTVNARKSLTSNRPCTSVQRKAFHNTVATYIKGLKKNIFVCSECDRKFSCKNKLKQHMALHADNSQICPDIHTRVRYENKLSDMAELPANSSHSGPNSDKEFSYKKELTQLITPGHCTEKPAEYLAGDQPHSCPECILKFEAADDLKEHVLTHFEKPHNCPECDEGFMELGLMKLHMLKTHYNDKRHGCPKCGRMFTQLVEFRKHIERHLEERPYGCEKCGKRFIREATFNRHLLTHRERSHCCLKCGEKFFSTELLKLHMSRHGEERYHKCTDCTKRCVSISEMKRHMIIHRSGKELHTCVECGMTYTRAHLLKRHMNRKHPTGETYTCSECGKSYTQEVYLKEHMAKHSRGKWRNCQECFQSFRKPADLLLHMNTVHSSNNEVKGEFVCQECGKGFSRDSDRELHMILHETDSCQGNAIISSLDGNLKISTIYARHISGQQL